VRDKKTVKFSSCPEAARDRNHRKNNNLWKVALTREWQKETTQLLRDILSCTVGLALK
jgi:hypothetical protein